GMGVSSGPSVAEAERLLAEGNALEDGGDPAAALSRYEAARAACPDFARVPLNLANALPKLGRVDDAIRTLTDAIAARTGDGAAHFNLGSLYLTQSRLEAAESAFRAALGADPALAEAAVGLASVLEAAGRPLEAVEELKRALALRPDYAYARFNL